MKDLLMIFLDLVTVNFKKGNKMTTWKDDGALYAGKWQQP